MKEQEYEFYEKTANWDFSKFKIVTEKYTKWDLYEKLETITNKNSIVLDLGTGGGERVLSSFPMVKQIVATDYSKAMIETANKNLSESGRENILFKVMNNLAMDTEDEYFDVVVARNTVIDAKQIYKTLKKGGYILIRGVDKLDCWELKRIFKKGQGYNDKKPISQIDYESILDAGFNDVELIPIHEIEYFEDKENFIKFLYKVPILDNFSYNNRINKELLENYIKKNTTKNGIRLIRRYYGIIGIK